MSFSQPSVARLINEAFIPVLFTMHLRGPGTDHAAREFVLSNPRAGRIDLFPPDLFVVSPSRELLGRLDYDASPDQTIRFLKAILRRRPDLAPTGGPDSLDPPVPPAPAETALAEIEQRYNRGPKAVLVPELEAWVRDHAGRHPDAAALARTLLGGALYHAGDHAGAYAAWRSVLRLHSGHPLRHRAAYNLVEPGSFPSPLHPDLVGASHPTVVERGVIVPDHAVRSANLRRVASDPRYVDLRAGLPFVRVPGGTFNMGGSPALQPRELPTRRVTITRPFLIAAWPVTRIVWKVFRPEAYPGAESAGIAGELPAVEMLCDEVNEFCQFLSRLDHRRYRLATEAEWEYAARGGLEGMPYPWGEAPPDLSLCNYRNPRMVPVACYPPNGYGLFDAVGNTHEWTSDYYRKDAYSLTPPEVVDPVGPTRTMAREASSDGFLWRVVRGGNVLSNDMARIVCRNSYRIAWPEKHLRGNVGIRLVTDPAG